MRLTNSIAMIALIVAGLTPSAALAQGRTVWHSLGIPQTWSTVRDATMNRFGNAPGLEKKPPVKGLADPSNLESDNPLLKTAAEIKKQEDLAPQKKKALKYLAKMGCGCYPGVAEAFIEGLRDCTEEVRVTAAESIQVASGNACASCNSDSCCAKEILEELAKIAYERDDHGCWLEPSETVRAAARQALLGCCPNNIPLEVIDSPGPKPDPQRKGDPGAQPDAGTQTLFDPPPVRQPEFEPLVLLPRTQSGSGLQAFVDTGHGVMAVDNSDPAPSPVPYRNAAWPQIEKPAPSSAPEKIAPVTRFAEGHVTEINREVGTITIACPKDLKPVIETQATVSHNYLLGPKNIGTVHIITSRNGHAYARVIDLTVRIGLGDPVRLKVEDPGAE